MVPGRENWAIDRVVAAVIAPLRLPFAADSTARPTTVLGRCQAGVMAYLMWFVVRLPGRLTVDSSWTAQLFRMWGTECFRHAPCSRVSMCQPPTVARLHEERVPCWRVTEVVARRQCWRGSGIRIRHAPWSRYRAMQVSARTWVDSSSLAHAPCAVALRIGFALGLVFAAGGRRMRRVGAMPHGHR